MRVSNNSKKRKIEKSYSCVCMCVAHYTLSPNKKIWETKFLNIKNKYLLFHVFFSALLLVVNFNFSSEIILLLTNEKLKKKHTQRQGMW